MLKIPDEWTKRLANGIAMDEATVRAMLVAIDSPEIAIVRAKVVTQRTSDLISVIADPIELLEKLIGQGCFDAYSDLEEQKLVLMACVAIVTDEIDRRIPVPASKAPP